MIWKKVKSDMVRIEDEVSTEIGLGYRVHTLKVCNINTTNSAILC